MIPWKLLVHFGGRPVGLKSSFRAIVQNGAFPPTRIIDMGRERYHVVLRLYTLDFV